MNLRLAAAAILALHAGSLHARTYLVDFGPDNGADGNVTPSGMPAINPGNGSTGVPDANGNHWNNVVGAGGTGGPVATSYLRLVDTANAPSPIGLTLGPGWKSNGKASGGLLAPDPLKLGDFAIARATEDYFYIEGAAAYATLNLNHLDPAKLYQLRLFGTRDTASVRRTTYTVSAGNGVFSATLQTSGADLTSSTDGNDSTILSLGGLQTDASGQLALRVSVAEGGFGHLGILELTEGEPAPPIASTVVRVDFGRHDVTNGNPTASPDGFGRHWNNFGTTANGSTQANLISTTGSATPLGITLTSTGWQHNGILNGGLTSPPQGQQAPLASRLGELAVETATQDYFFVQNTTGALRISGLDPSKLYSMRFFGTRDEAQVRRSTYTVTAGNGTFAGTLRTSGTGVGTGLGGGDGTVPYNGNNRSTVALGGIQADHGGEVTLQLSVAEGGFAYLGILEIVEGAAVPPLPLPAITNGIDRWTAQDALDPIAPGSVLFVGSSSIRRWEALAEDFAGYRIIQRGFGGSQFSDINPILHRIVTPYQASAIVVFAGTNDIRAGGKTGEQVFADFQAFVAGIRAVQPEVPVCYIEITPAPVYFSNAGHNASRVTANALIKAHCESDPALKLHFFAAGAHFDALRESDPAAWNAYFSDGLHLTPAGYAKWSEAILPALQAVVAPDKPLFAANPAALQAGDKLFFDFGPSQSTVGDPTTGPDANGHRWNNWHSTNGGGLVNSGEHLAGLVRSTGTATGIRMTMTGGFEVNGKSGFGGLLAPDPALLGELAVATATQDFFYSHSNSDDLPGSFMLSGLDPALSYEFRFFGSRAAAEIRTTKFTAAGANGDDATLQTSGTGIGSSGGDGNNDEVAVVAGIRPDGFGQVFIDLDRLQGGFAYLNAMQITASAPVSAYQGWRAGKFTPQELADSALEAALWGDDADPDGDGRSNLLEYATGTEPRIAGPGAMESGLEDDGDTLTLTYQRNLDATDVSFQVEKATNLADWSDVDDFHVSTAGNLETRKATVSTAGFSKLWLRLRAELVP